MAKTTKGAAHRKARQVAKQKQKSSARMAKTRAAKYTLTRKCKEEFAKLSEVATKTYDAADSAKQRLTHYLAGARSTMGVPDGYEFDSQTLCFIPPSKKK